MWEKLSIRCLTWAFRIIRYLLLCLAKYTFASSDPISIPRKAGCEYTHRSPLGVRCLHNQKYIHFYLHKLAMVICNKLKYVSYSIVKRILKSTKSLVDRHFVSYILQTPINNFYCVPINLLCTAPPRVH